MVTATICVSQKFSALSYLSPTTATAPAHNSHRDAPRLHCRSYLGAEKTSGAFPSPGTGANKRRMEGRKERYRGLRIYLEFLNYCKKIREKKRDESIETPSFTPWLICWLDFFASLFYRNYCVQSLKKYR